MKAGCPAEADWPAGANTAAGCRIRGQYRRVEKRPLPVFTLPALERVRGSGLIATVNFHRHKYPVMQCITGILMAAGTQKDLAIGAVVGAIVMAVIDLVLPFAGPFIGGFIAGFLAKGDAVQATKAGVLAGLLAAVVITIATYLKLVNSEGGALVAGWGTGLLLYLLIGLYFVAIAFLGALIASVIRK